MSRWGGFGFNFSGDSFISKSDLIVALSRGLEVGFLWSGLTCG